MSIAMRSYNYDDISYLVACDGSCISDDYTCCCQESDCDESIVDYEYEVESSYGASNLCGSYSSLSTDCCYYEPTCCDDSSIPCVHLESQCQCVECQSIITDPSPSECYDTDYSFYNDDCHQYYNRDRNEYLPQKKLEAVVLRPQLVQKMVNRTNDDSYSHVLKKKKTLGFCGKYIDLPFYKPKFVTLTGEVHLANANFEMIAKPMIKITKQQPIDLKKKKKGKIKVAVPNTNNLKDAKLMQKKR